MADFLRVMTAGSVDDGKSTLIGRLMYGAGSIPEDEIATVQHMSAAMGLPAGELDYSLFVDGLEAEREQGITIDVAHRYFRTAQRVYHLLDSPGHVQYTRNMATAASQADAAIVLVDVHNGLTSQTARHLAVLKFFGVAHICIAANKMDLVEYDEAAFAQICTRLRAIADELDMPAPQIIPISAKLGDNVTEQSLEMPWYSGSSIAQWLANVPAIQRNPHAPFRLSVQLVERDAQNKRTVSGTIASGTVNIGDLICVAGNGAQAKIKSIGQAKAAYAGQAVALKLDSEIDVIRGDLLCTPDSKPHVVDQFSAHLLWAADAPLTIGRSYFLKIGARQVPATISKFKHHIAIPREAIPEAQTLAKNQMGTVNIATTGAIAFDALDENPATSRFILMDRQNGETLAAGYIDHALRRAENVHEQGITITRRERATLKHQTPCVVWLTGLSGSGKSTIANALEQRLHAEGKHSYIIDGDNLRLGLCRDLGFTVQDRIENIRRAGEMAKAMMDAGLIVIVALVSPIAEARAMVRDNIGAGFIEVFVDTPIETCIARDPKGLYAKAKAGLIPNFTGLGQEYERPERVDIHLHTAQVSLVECVNRIHSHISRLQGANESA